MTEQASDWPLSPSKHFASMSEFQQQKRAQSQEGDSQNFFAGGSEHRYMTYSGPAKSGGSLPRPILECNVSLLLLVGS